MGGQLESFILKLSLHYIIEALPLTLIVPLILLRQILQKQDYIYWIMFQHHQTQFGIIKILFRTI